MEKNRSLEDFFAGSEESSLVCLVEIVGMASGSLRKIFNFKGIEHDDLVNRLMSRVGNFSYQDDDVVLDDFIAKAKFCENIFEEKNKHVCVLGAILATPETVACRVLESIGVDCEKMLSDIAREFKFEKDIFGYKSKKEVIMSDTVKSGKKRVAIASDYGVDLTQKYEKETPNAFVAREKYILQLARMLGRMQKNSVLMLGGSGVGKTAIVNELAYRIASGKISGSLADMTVFELMFEECDDLPKKYSDMSAFVSRIMNLFDDLSKVVFFVDWQEVVLSGANSDIFTTFDFLNSIGPIFRESRARFVLVGHQESYDDFIMDFPQVSGLVGILRVEEASEEETIEIVKARKSSYEDHHGVEFSDAAIRRIMVHNKNDYGGVYLPGRALDILDDLGSDFSKSGSVKIGEAEVELFFKEEKAVSTSIVSVKEGYESKLPTLARELKNSVIGQSVACDLTADAIMAINDPDKPIASLFYAGPSGVGKTLLARKLAEILFGDSESFIRLDMSEYYDRHEIARLIGSPPGYVGYDDGSKLANQLKKRPSSVILLDEIEKAHYSIFDILLQIMDYGSLTNGKGERMCFRRSVLAMTSNIDLRKGRSMGFAAEKNSKEKRMAFGQAMQDNSFRKEFIGRVDQFVEFSKLSSDDFLKIVDLEIAKIAESAKRRGLGNIIFNQDAKELVVAQSETSEYGARNLTNTLLKLVRIPLGKILVHGGPREKVEISVGDNGLVFI